MRVYSCLHVRACMLLRECMYLRACMYVRVYSCLHVRACMLLRECMCVRLRATCVCRTTFVVYMSVFLSRRGAYVRTCVYVHVEQRLWFT